MLEKAFFAKSTKNCGRVELSVTIASTSLLEEINRSNTTSPKTPLSETPVGVGSIESMGLGGDVSTVAGK